MKALIIRTLYSFISAYLFPYSKSDAHCHHRETKTKHWELKNIYLYDNFNIMMVMVPVHKVTRPVDGIDYPRRVVCQFTLHTSSR